jgi:hypothetical protein
MLRAFYLDFFSGGGGRYVTACLWSLAFDRSFHDIIHPQ